MGGEQQVVEHILDDGRLVDRVGERKPDVGIVERRLSDVEGEVEDRKLRTGNVELVELGSRIADAFDVVESNEGLIQLIVLELLHRAAGKAYGDLAHLGWFKVIVVETLQRQPLAELPVGEAERSAAVWRERPALRIVLDLVAVEHVRGRIGQLVEEHRRLLLDRDVQRDLIDHLDADDFVGSIAQELGCAHDVAEEVRRGGRERLRSQVALDAPLEVLGGDAFAVVESRIVPNRESVSDRAVAVELTGGHRLGEVGRDPQAAVKHQQDAEHLDRDHGRTDVGDLGRIQVDRLGSIDAKLASLARQGRPNFNLSILCLLLLLDRRLTVFS